MVIDVISLCAPGYLHFAPHTLPCLPIPILCTVCLRHWGKIDAGEGLSRSILSSVLVGQHSWAAEAFPMGDTAQLGSAHSHIAFFSLFWPWCEDHGDWSLGGPGQVWCEELRDEEQTGQVVVNEEIVLLVIRIREAFVQNLQVLTSAGDPGDADVQEHDGILAFSFFLIGSCLIKNKLKKSCSSKVNTQVQASFLGQQFYLVF